MDTYDDGDELDTLVHHMEHELFSESPNTHIYSQIHIAASSVSTTICPLINTWHIFIYIYIYIYVCTAAVAASAIKRASSCAGRYLT